MRKRIVSLLLSLALCLSLLPTAALAEEAQPTEPLPGEQLEQVEPIPEKPEENEEQPQQDKDVIAVQEQNSGIAPLAENADAHSHPICGDSGCTDSKHSVESWTAVSTATELTNLTGKGYLTQNIDLANTWEPVDGVVLCLNGYSIIGASDKPVISVKSGVFNLTDCKGGSTTGEYGKITHKNTESGRGVNVYATFNMYGGSITGNKTSSYGGGGVYVNGTFNMYGGSITGNKAESYNGVGGGGGGVCVNINSSFHMYGGSIAGNSASTDGGGVYVNYGSFEMSGSASITGNTATGNGGGVSLPSGDFTVSGHVQITGNTSKTDSSQSNVFLGTNKYITIGEGGLTNGAEIGVTTATEPTEAAPITIAKNAKDGTEKYFTSDKGYYPVFKENKIVLDTSKPHTHPICGDASCNEHGENLTWTGVSSLSKIKTAGYYYLTQNVTIDDTWTPANGVKLCLNGYSITSKSNSSSIKVDTGVTFTLTDCNGSNHGNGTVTHDTNYTGRGVTVDTDGSFYMYGGSISHNEITSGTVRQGSGVTVNAGGAFHMYGGSISGNKVSGSNSVGGGVYVGSGTFHMYGGSIAGNTAKSGGGVYMGSGTFHMYGGSISGNTASVNGGGVYVSGGGTFNMSDSALIAGNIATGTDYNGGGGVLLNSGTFNVSGSVSISGNTSSYSKDMPSNVLLSYGQTITIGNSLTDSASIGVSLDNNNYPSSGNRTQIATNATGNVDYAKIFAPDVSDKGYVVTKDESGNLYLSTHQHNWMYTVTADEGKTQVTVTAVCNGCPDNIGTQTRSYNAPQNLTYNGVKKEVESGAGEASEGVVDPFTGLTVTYKTQKGENWEPLTDNAKPTNAGTYRAIIAVGEESAYVEYTIAKADPQAGDFTFTAPTDLTYDGTAKEATAALNSSKTGAGDITVKYFKDGTEVTEAKDAGKYTVKISVAGGDNYNAAPDLTADGWKFTINKTEQTITVPSNKTIVKNGIAVDISAGVSVQGVQDEETGAVLTYTLDGSPNGVTLSQENGAWLLSAASDTTANEVTIKVTAAATDNYEQAENTFTVTVIDKEPATVTITGLPTILTYGDTFTLTASQTGDTTGTNKKWAWNYDTDYFKSAGSDANTGVLKLQAIKAGTPTKPIAATYTSNTHTGSAQTTVTVIPKELTITGVTAERRDYVPNDTSVTLNGGTLQGVVGTDTVTFELGTGTIADAGAGTGKPVTTTIQLTGSGAGNYTLTQPTDIKVTIDRASWTYTKPSGLTAKYGQKLGEITLTNPESNLPGTWKWQKPETALDQIGSQTYYADFEPEDQNYKSVKNAGINVTVGKADAQTLADIDVRQKYTVTTEQSEQIGSIMPADAGTLTYTAGSSSVSGTATVSSFTVDNSGLVKYTITGGTNGAVITLPVTITSTNYEDSTVNVVITLTDKDDQATLTLTGGTTVVYGQTLTLGTSGGSGSGAVTYEVVSGGTGAATIAGNVLTPTTAGTVMVKAVKAADDDYNQAESAVVTITIKKAVVTVTASNKSAYVNGTAPALTDPVLDTDYTVSGLFGNDTLTGTLALNYVDADGKTITPDMSKAGETIIRASGVSAGDNYTVNFVDGKLTVTNRPSSGGSSSGSSSVADAAIRAIKNAKPGETVTIDMKGETKMPARVLDAAYGKDITLNFDMGDGTVWSVNGLDIPKGGVALNLGIKTGTKSIPVKLINAITGEVSNVQLQLSHSGEFGLTLTLFLDLGKEFDGMFANLYYYNDKADTLEFQSSCKISGGTASWPFDHASEYAIVIDEVDHDAARFTDVAANAYYADAVKWALQNGITNGISDTAFGSNDPCTRAQIVTFLWRAAGSPEPKSASSFTDVPADSYYAKAVAWAVENGVTGGTGDGKFSPNAPCTREQAVTFLYRASGSPAVSGGSDFSDVAANAYYADAVAWAEQNGITGGIGNGKFGTGSDCTRAQIVAFLHRSFLSK